MKYFKIVCLKIFLLLSFYNCSNNEALEEINNTLDPLKAYQELNIAYGTDSKQTFDLYLPANRTSNTKVMVLVHGGGWVSGDKSEMDQVKDLVKQDFPNLAIVNINYRLAGLGNPPFPMQIDDVSSVVTFLKENKTKYTISNKFGFIGTSAGAHLSLLYSYASDTGKNVNMVCSIVGPTNFTDPAYINNTDTSAQLLLGLFGVSPTNTSFLESVSPYHQVTSTAPPTIMFYSGMDELIPTSQGTDLRDKLLNLNITHEFTLYPNTTHGGIIVEISDIWAKLNVFTQTHL